MVLTESGSHAVKETTLCAVQYVRPMQSHLQGTAHLIRGGGDSLEPCSSKNRNKNENKNNFLLIFFVSKIVYDFHAFHVLDRM